MSTTENPLFISAFIHVHKAWKDCPINLNLRDVFAIIFDQIMTAFKKIIFFGRGTMGSAFESNLANARPQVVLLV